MLGSNLPGHKTLAQLNTVRISKPVSTVRLEPSINSEASSELLFGESIQLLEHTDAWSSIRSTHDGYEGFIETSDYESTEYSSTHWVSSQATLVFTDASIKSPVEKRLLFGSKLTGKTLANDNQSGATKFLQLESGGFVWAAHCLQKNAAPGLTMTEIAEANYLNTPYLWGGRSTNGCDCSGLVQMLASAIGFSLPRDSGDQEAALTSTIEFQNRTAEDLVYWSGHVGVLKSPELLLHATAHSMSCCIEPLKSVIHRAGLPTSIKRIQSEYKANTKRLEDIKSL